MVEWTWCHCWVPLQGAVDMVPLLGAFIGCHCSVLWLGGRVTTNFGGVDVVPLLGAICSVRWLGERVTTKLWGEGTWWHCRCYGWGGVTANFAGVDVVPLQGAIVVCYGWGGG